MFLSACRTRVWIKIKLHIGVTWTIDNYTYGSISMHEHNGVKWVLAGSHVTVCACVFMWFYKNGSRTDMVLLLLSSLVSPVFHFSGQLFTFFCNRHFIHGSGWGGVTVYIREFLHSRMWTRTRTGMSLSASIILRGHIKSTTCAVISYNFW